MTFTNKGHGPAVFENLTHTVNEQTLCHHCVRQPDQNRLQKAHTQCAKFSNKLRSSRQWSTQFCHTTRKFCCFVLKPHCFEQRQLNTEALEENSVAHKLHKRAREPIHKCNKMQLYKMKHGTSQILCESG